MFICKNCNKEFDEANERQTTYESEYGILDQVMSRTPLTILICPYCSSEEIEEKNEKGDF